MRSSILILFICIAFNKTGKAQVVVPSGEFRNIVSKDFLANNYSSKFYNELYTYQIQLDNGVQIVYTFSINDFGSFKSRVTGAKLMVRWLNNKNYVVNKEYSVKQFINKADSNILVLHPERSYWAKGSFEDEHTVNFKTRKNGVEYDIKLTLYDIFPGVIWDDGVFKIKGNDFGIKMLIPHAKVKGYVSINGEKVLASGSGMMDLTYQKNLPSKFLKKGYRIKSGDEKNGIVLNLYTVKHKGKLIPFGYGLKFRNGVQEYITPNSIEFIDKKHTHGIKFDTEFNVELSDSTNLEFKLVEKFNSYSILDELGGIRKTIAKWVLRGEAIEINGIAEINNKPGYFTFLVIK